MVDRLAGNGKKRYLQTNLSIALADSCQFSQVLLHPNNPATRIITAEAFRPEDPWSKHKREKMRLNAHLFSGKRFIELGGGDGKNGVEIIHDLEQARLPQITGIESIDIAYSVLPAAERNFQDHAKPRGIPHVIFSIKANEWIERQKTINDAVVVMCLPQAPLNTNNPTGTTSVADVYNTTGIPEQYLPYDTYGLALNAATLGELWGKTGRNVFVFILFSGRVPQPITENMIADLGWEISAKHVTENPVQQDPKTSVAYTLPYAPNYELVQPLFWEQSASGAFVPISAAEADQRQSQQFDTGFGRINFNVHHDLIEYILVKKQSSRRLQL